MYGMKALCSWPGTMAKRGWDEQVSDIGARRKNPYKSKEMVKMAMRFDQEDLQKINMWMQAVMQYKYPMCFWNDSCQLLRSGLNTTRQYAIHCTSVEQGRTLPTYDPPTTMIFFRGAAMSI